MAKKKKLSERCSYCGTIVKKGDMSKHKQMTHADLVLSGAIKTAELLSNKAIEKLIERSNKLILQGDPESAIFALRQVLEVRPYDKEARNILAFALKEAGKNKEAKKVLDKSRDEKLEN